MRRNDVQYYESNGGSAGRVFAGVLIGGLIGAALGFLMAPMSGDELRRTIREEFDEAQERAMSAMEDAQEKGRQMQDKGREVVEGIRGDVENLRDNVKDTVRKRRKSLSKILGG